MLLSFLVPATKSRKLIVKTVLIVAVFSCLIVCNECADKDLTSPSSPKSDGAVSTTTTASVVTQQQTNETSKASVAATTAGSASSSSIPSEAPVVATLTPTVPVSIQPLLGVNGTGQRKFYPSPKPTIVSDPILAVPIKVGMPLKDPPTPSPSPAGVKLDPPSSTNWDDDIVNIDNVDIDFEKDKNKTISDHNITQVTEEYHVFYNSTSVQDVETVKNFFNSIENLTTSHLLSKSHRRAMTVQLQFDFPFYGNPIRNITIATGGFIYTGEYVHSWLAATQYIAPLMANFDTSLSNDSFVKYFDNGTAITVLWENVLLQDHTKNGSFSFSATLHKNGDIIFGYYSIPMPIEAIEDKKHPVKVGLSDAYISDKTIFFARRKTIYEYHRVTFDDVRIRNNTLIILKAEPTCISVTDCVSCLGLTTFKCGWCPMLNICSTGIDRKRHEWLQRGCDKGQIVSKNECPALGAKGNNAADKTDSSQDSDVVATHITNKEASKPGPESSHDAPQMSPIINTSDSGEHRGGVSTAMGVLIPMCVVIMFLAWVIYAYRNPHTKSGQLLIQYRPSQWSWRRGEARYTAATIHM